MKNAVLLAATLAAGCATQGPVVQEGTASSVSVNWYESNTGSQGALAAAEAHCQQYGKTAKFAGKVNTFTASYDCIQP